MIVELKNNLIKKFFIFIIAICMIASGLLSSTLSVHAVNPTPDNSEIAVVKKTNRERAKEGVNALKYDLAMQEYADIRAEELSESFSHTRPNGESLNYTENITRLYPTALEATNAWMLSVGHKANMLESHYKSTAVGHYEVNGYHYWVILFNSDEPENELKIPEESHDMKNVPEKEAGCETQGNIEYWYCSDCNSYFLDEYGDEKYNSINDTKTEPTGHNHVATTYPKSATCTTDGNILYYYCKDCGQYFTDSKCQNKVSYKDTVIEAINHKNAVKHAYTPATCTVKGNKEYWYCGDCKQYFTSNKFTDTFSSLNDTVIPATGHHMSPFKDRVEATCTEAGNYEYYYCNQCDMYFADEARKISYRDKNDTIIPAKGHSSSPTHYPRVEATTTKEGNIEYWQCPKCEKYYKDEALTQEIKLSDTKIAKKTSNTYTPTVKGYSGTYDGKAHTITIDGVKDGSTIQYRTSTTGSWSTTKPTRTNTGTTTVYYQITNSNYNTVSGSQTITVNKASYSVTAKGYSGIYDGKAHTITIDGVKDGSTIQYRTNTTASWSTTKPTRTNIGTTAVYYQITNSNYNTVTGNANITINKATYKPTVKEYSGAYDSKSHTITISGVKDGSIIEYRTSTTASWSTTKPTRTTAGTTTVYYQITNDNYNTVTGNTKITISKKAVSKLTVTGVPSTKVYTGKAIKPTVTVKDGSKTLKKGTDYTVTYGTNNSTGKATIKITGKGNYSGSVAKTFYIVPKAPTSLKLTAASKSLKVSYKKSTGASGYQIAYSTKKSSGYKTVTSTSASKTLSRLSAKKTYYVKVRAYKTVNGKKYYGAYTTIKSKKTK